MSGSVILCPFWRESRRSFAVEVCDNLVGGVPACVVAEFYPDVDPFALSDVERERYVRGLDDFKICSHFVRSDIYSALDIHPSVIKRGCFFGGVRCVHADVVGFGACVGCSRFVR
jgi:hypothetical protein